METSGNKRDFERCAVIGGAGMLGHEIVRQLVRAGKKVRVLDLEPPPERCCDSLIGDVRSREDVHKACEGADVVFQCAAAVWKAGTPRHIYEGVNVAGNRNVVGACTELGIRRLVYTSTIDVVVEGRRPIVDGDESLPYPKRLPREPYCRTKILAEQLVLSANGPELATCALRPVGMYGPRDRYHLGNILAMARRGNKIRLGSGRAPAESARAPVQRPVPGRLRIGLRGRTRGSELELQPFLGDTDLRRSHLSPRSGGGGPGLSSHRLPGRGLSANHVPHPRGRLRCIPTGRYLFRVRPGSSSAWGCWPTSASTWPGPSGTTTTWAHTASISASTTRPPGC